MRSSAFDDFDPQVDAVWMAEVADEANHVWCHKLRIAAFLSAMRHFRDTLKSRGLEVHYTELSTEPRQDRGPDLATVLRADVMRLAPAKLVVVEPGDYRVRSALNETALELGVELEIRSDRHFYVTPAQFDVWAQGRKRLRLEAFYRHLRRRFEILVDADGEPIGGRWSFDDQNRASFGKTGPPKVKPPRRFRTDRTTDDVCALIERRFVDHPGRLEEFDLPVTHHQAQALLRDFIEHRLPSFGVYQDAMWVDHPFLFHSRLSFPLNVKLLDPRACIRAAIDAHRRGAAPINSVEGFVRQILGWREFVRGIYWRFMPEYAVLNVMRCEDRPVPGFFWDGSTKMACVADAVRGLIAHGYTHHIQRLMVLGLFAQLAGVHPRRFHEWHMAMYVDAIDWVSLPNALGMSQYGDGGVVGSKPYCASGNYISKMSNYCGSCGYDPTRATGSRACPFTTLYWDYLARHEDQLQSNPRMGLQFRNLDRKRDEIMAIRNRAAGLKSAITRGDRI